VLVLIPTVLFGFVVLQAGLSPAVPAATTQHEQTGDARKMTLTLPYALGEGETAWLLVKVGAIDHHEIRLTTEDGRDLGTISPFSVRSSHAAGTYTVPVPPEAFHDARLALRISIVQSGRSQRSPTHEEVKHVRLVIRRFKKQPSTEPNP
jgi:hypothetical protein